MDKLALGQCSEDENRDMSNEREYLPWAAGGVFVSHCTMSPLGRRSRNPRLPKEERRDAAMTAFFFLFDLQGKLKKSLSPFTSVQGLTHRTHLPPMHTGHISHEFLH